MNARRLLAWTVLLTTACMAPRPCQARPSIRDEVLAPYLKLPPRAEPAKQGIGPAGLMHQTTELSCVGGQWSDEFAIAGLDYTPLCATFFEGDLVVGGQFRHADGRRVNSIARWDGQEWHPLGDGFPTPVRALAIWKGRLVAAGEFSVYGTISGSLAAWNGVQWEPLGGGVEGYVPVIATNDTDLVIARQTYTETSTPCYLSRWDGSAWHSMGEPIDGQVLAIARYGGEWVVGGFLGRAGATELSNVARWDGAAWQPLDRGLSQTQGTAVVLAMAPLAGELIVGGQFDSAGSVAVTGIARWNGAGWNSLAGAPPMLTSAMISDGDVVHIGHWSGGPLTPGGNRFLATWDGLSFAHEAIGPEGMPQAIAVDGDRLAVVGWFERVDDRPIRMVAVREGDRWSPAAAWRSPMRGLTAPVHDFELYEGSLVAAGEFAYAADDTGWIAANGASRWDGERWREMGQGLGPTWGGDLLVHQGSLYHAAGYVRRWNGQSWEFVGRHVPTAISHLASLGGRLWGAGICYIGCTGGLWRYDEPDWVSVAPPAGVPAESSFVTALAVHRGQLVVAWAWGSEYWQPRTRLATWDGTRWQLLPGLFEGGRILALASYRGRVCASGDFWTIDGHPDRGFSILESTGWDSHGWGGGRGNAMASTDSLLVVGGNRLTFFDGAGWCYLDQASGEILTLLADGRSLWVGGYFDRVGETPSYSVARWDGLPVASPAPKLVSLAAGPNPFRDQVSLYFQLEREARVRLSVLDLMGREVAVLLDGLESIGEHSTSWTGQDDRGRAVPAGLYFARLEIRGLPDRVRRLVRVQ